jgi:hypothetical protein
MTSYQSPITPPPELWGHWHEVSQGRVSELAALAAQWGANQELDACCEWLNGGSQIDYDTAALLRAARRPKPPSLKEQAMMGLSRIESTGEFFSDGMKDLATIRRALEQLPE